MEPNTDNIILSLRHSSREMIRELGFLEYEKYYLGLTPSQVHALIEVDLRGVITSLKLAEFLRLDKSTISRLVKALFIKGLVEIHDNPDDDRSKLIKCSAGGLQIIKEINAKAFSQVKLALSNLTEEEHKMIEKAMGLYSRSLRKSRLIQEYAIREITLSDNLELSAILAEFNTERAGFSDMYEFYTKAGSCYYVIAKDKKIYGGIGIIKLANSENICEIQQMYLAKEVRGLGLEQVLMENILKKASALNYKYCYLETLAFMDNPKLYHKFGFEKLTKSLRDAEYCDSWYLKTL